MENTQRSLPQLLNTAMVITISSFTLVAVTFYLCLPFEIIRATTAPALVSLFCPRLLPKFFIMRALSLEHGCLSLNLRYIGIWKRPSRTGRKIRLFSGYLHIRTGGY